jgi:hypothetical protein
MRRRVRTHGLFLLWAFAAVLIVWGGTQPGYRPGHMGETTAPYPVLWVLAFLALSAVELALAQLILRPRSYAGSWHRALLATLVFVPWAVFCMAATMHMPGFVTAHALWAFVLGVLSLLLLLLSGVSAAWRCVRDRAV